MSENTSEENLHYNMVQWTIKKKTGLDRRVETSRPKVCFYHKAEILQVGQKPVGRNDVFTIRQKYYK